MAGMKARCNSAEAIARSIHRYQECKSRSSGSGVRNESTPDGYPREK